MSGPRTRSPSQVSGEEGLVGGAGWQVCRCGINTRSTADALASYWNVCNTSASSRPRGEGGHRLSAVIRSDSDWN